MDTNTSEARQGLAFLIERMGSQQAVADALGVGQTLVSYWLRNTGMPAEYLARAHAASGVRPQVIRPDLKEVLR